jgi:hypothetical protein
MTTRDLRHDGLRPRPRKRRRGARLDRHERARLRAFHRRRLSPQTRVRPSPRRTPPAERLLAEVTQGTAKPTSTPRSLPPPAPSRNGRSSPAMTARDTSTRSRGSCRSTPASSPCWKPRQRQADPREPRHRHPAGAAAFLLPRGAGAASDRELPGAAPLGVCGQIIPWNFPLLMLAWKIAPALAAGQHGGAETGRIHLAHRAAFRRYLPEAGLPKGVVNIVTGDGATGEAIVEHPGIAKIAFTGSTAVGRRIRGATAGHGKALTLELGGKSPYIVFDDADIDSAIEGLVDAIWFNQGQVCCAGSRLLVQEGIAEDFHTRLKAPDGQAARRRPARQMHRRRRGGRPGAARRDHRAGGRQHRRRGLSRGDRPAGDGMLLPADADHRARARRAR